MLKLEIRISKSETIAEDGNPKFETGPSWRQRLCHLNFGHFGLFRISDFGFRI